MNAVKDWMIVMIMPHVLMLVMATPVPVTLGTQAMEQSVKVSPSYNWHWTIYYNSSSLDVDECAGNDSVCDEHATCTDTEGSFLCTCNTGFSGDGYNCSSEFSNVWCCVLLVLNWSPFQTLMSVRQGAMYVINMLCVKTMRGATSVYV